MHCKGTIRECSGSSPHAGRAQASPNGEPAGSHKPQLAQKAAAKGRRARILTKPHSKKPESQTSNWFLKEIRSRQHGEMNQQKLKIKCTLTEGVFTTAVIC